jgi:adenosine/AMP kinase
MQLHAVRLTFPPDSNIIVGSSHFIKTVEDLYEALVNTVPGLKFGIAFSEASGPCLIRVDGNDEELQAVATGMAEAVGAGHTFYIVMRNGYPINVLGRIKDVPEVCTIHCASANPVEVIVAQTEQGRGVMGVIDGFAPKGVEDEAGREWRHSFLRKIGYKR